MVELPFDTNEILLTRWWWNLLGHVNDNYQHIPLQERHVIITDILTKYGARITHSGIEFDNEADSTVFLLRWA